MNDSNKLFWSITGLNDNSISFSFAPSMSVKQLVYFDWVESTVEIKSGCFNGKVKLSITLTDVFTFLKQIELMYKDLRGAAQFSTIEDQVYFNSNMNKLGQVSIEGYLRDSFGYTNELKFSMESDQPCLLNCISEINNFMKTIESINSV